MYAIKNEQNCSPTKAILHRSTSFGLIITILQLCLELKKIFDLIENDVEEGVFQFVSDELVTERPTTTDAGNFEIEEANSDGSSSAEEENFSSFNVNSSKQPQLPGFSGSGDLFIVSILLYAKIFLYLVDVYTYAVVRNACQKDCIYDCWLGLYLQISLLTYNTTEILIGAYKGSFDGSSMLLAARTTVRAISIEVICLFLREIEVKQETDLFLQTTFDV